MSHGECRAYVRLECVKPFKKADFLSVIHIFCVFFLEDSPWDIRRYKAFFHKLTHAERCVVW
jgi:hypothetical protein